MSSSGGNTISGMALAIRSAEDSETFDFAGASASTIQQMILDAFSSPFNLSKMIRLTFITGAGKLERQKYDENAARIVMNVLRDVGYQEDRGASAVMECAGTFKSQHDTAKNLKTVVVFPKIREETCVTICKENENKEEEDSKQSILESSLIRFQKLLEYKCPSWSQKKTCLLFITETEEKIRALDKKLMNGTPLDTAEQQLYESSSLQELEEKEKYLKAELSKHVEEGTITAREKLKLLGQMQERIDALSNELNDAKEGKKADILREQRDKVRSKVEHVQKMIPQSPLPLKHEATIAQLMKELKPLVQLENETKGRLLSLKEATALKRKAEILDEIQKLEDASRGWFEDEADFKGRVEASRSIHKSNNVGKTKGEGNPRIGDPSPHIRSSTSVSSKPVTSWITPSKGKTDSTVTLKKAGSSTTKANTFAAMMMDSDSD